MKEEIPSLVKDLASAASDSVEVQNRYWIAVAVTSLFALVPQPISGASAGLTLPFGLPLVDASWFALLAVLVLGALIIAFAAAQARAVRIARLAYQILETEWNQGELIAGHDVRDVFDALRKPSLGQVASLAQVLKGRHQFFVENSNSPAWRRYLSASAYLFYKLPSLVVWIGLPALALYYSAMRFLIAGPPAFLSSLWPPAAWLMVLAAAVALLTAFCIEVGFTVRAVTKAWLS
jgi:hypothetical protein